MTKKELQNIIKTASSQEIAIAVKAYCTETYTKEVYKKKDYETETEKDIQEVFGI